MSNLEEKLDKYAELLVRVGANLQPGQPLVIGAGAETINASVESMDFIRRIAQQGYKAGARYVHVNWYDPEIARLNMENAAEEDLAEYPAWKIDWFMKMVEQEAAFIMTYSPNTSLYEGIDPKRLTTFKKAETEALAPFRYAYHSTMSVNWVLAALPTKAWAAIVFPELSEEEAYLSLQAMILKANRVDTTDPVEAWKEHLSKLRVYQDYLNQTQFKRLHYKALGTDLTIELPENHAWISGASSKNKNGVPFIPNMPTEEVFISPHREGVHGVVRSTLPLIYNNVLIENMELRFENGRIVDYSATKGLDVLRGMIETDEGSHYLGEIALVPVTSPINQLGKIFYNTLFDENASCHFAIGNGFPLSVENGTSISKEELTKLGVNSSAVHVDFMIGSELLNIDGETTSGEIVPIFRHGNWAIPL